MNILDQNVIEHTQDHYTLTDANHALAGSVELICPECLQNSCKHTTNKYPGILCYRDVNASYKAYIPCEYINKVVLAHNATMPYATILHYKSAIAIPHIKIPCMTEMIERRQSIGKISYNTISKLYFTDQHDLCLLTGLPDITLDVKYNKDYPNFFLDTVYESMLSSNGSYTQRKAYFTYGKKETEFPFGLLVMVPAMYHTCLDMIQTQTCLVSRDSNKTVFSNLNIASGFPEEMKKPLKRMFVLLSKYGCFNNDSKEMNGNTWQNVAKQYIEIFRCKKFLCTDRMDLVRFALCAKLANNSLLARSFLKIYDHIEKKVQCKPEGVEWRIFYLKPFGGIDGPNTRWGWARYDKTIKSDFNSVIQCLRTFSMLEKDIEQIRQRKYIVPINNEFACIEIRKEEDKHILYPWQLESRWHDNHPNCDWIRGEPFLLKNCQGTIVGGSFNTQEYKWMIEIDTISVIEKRGIGDGTVYMKYTLHRDQQNQSRVLGGSMEDQNKSPESMPKENHTHFNIAKIMHYQNMISLSSIKDGITAVYTSMRKMFGYYGSCIKRIFAW